MNSELQMLINLQELDQKVSQLEENVKQIPRDIDSLNRTLEETRQTFQQTQQSLEDENKERRRLEGEVEDLQQKLSKYKGQLIEVKTNKEYQALLHEIETIEREISAKEDNVIERLMAADEWEKKAQRSQKELKEKDGETLERLKELEAFTEHSEDEIAGLQQGRVQLQEKIPYQLTEQYNRISSARNGMALAEAKDQSCQGCHVRLRPQLFNDLKTNQHIIACESCNRILYYVSRLEDRHHR